MNRVCLTKDGKLIEMQSGGKVDRMTQDAFATEQHYLEYLIACDELEASRLATLKKNALNAGYLESDIEIKWVTGVEYEAIKAVDPNEIARIAEQTAKETAQLAKAQEIIDNLPDWQQVSNAIDSATTIAALKVITKKLARVVYIHLRE